MIECPLCGTNNPEGSSECSQCMYQLGKASFQQVTTIDESQTNDLFDQLLADSDEEDQEEVIDWSRGSFKMEDVTIDVEQYDESDGIKMSINPTFAMTVDHPESSEEDDEEYELTAADAPAFVTKFEIPEEEEEILEEIPKQQITLVEPIESFSVDDTSEEEALDPPLSSEFEEVFNEEPPANLMNLKKAELIEMAQEAGLSTSGNKSEIVERLQVQDSQSEPPNSEENLEQSKEVESLQPPPPLLRADMPAPPPPPVAARPVDPMDAAFDGNNTQKPPTIPRIPRPPTLPHLMEEEIENSDDNGFWPWPQQEEWQDRDLVMKIRDAMEAAKRKENAQATVLIDEVGPHLGERTKLLYPVGALLQRIGRASAVDKMIEKAIEAYPEDPHVKSAKAKLRP